MVYLLVILVGFLLGFVVSFGTACLIGPQRAANLPGGALSIGIITGCVLGTPSEATLIVCVFIGFCAGLAGHIVATWCEKRVFRFRQ